MSMMEKAMYLKGLCDGLEPDKTTKEGKLIAALLDMVMEMAEEIDDLQEQVDELEDYCDELDSDLGDVEEVLLDLDDDCFDYDDDDDDDDDEDDEDNKKSKKKNVKRRNPALQAISSLLWTLTVVVYLLLGFLLGAWHPGWIVFIITVAVDNIVEAIFELAGKKYI